MYLHKRCPAQELAGGLDDCSSRPARIVVATGRTSCRLSAVIADVVHLAGTRYQGVNHTHLSELLSEREGIHIGRTTLRRILLDAGLSSPRRRRPPKHRVRRQRMPRAGMLIQLDGSYHRWLGDVRPPFTLLLAVDDALFCKQEDSHNYFLLMQNLLRRRGIPLALYPTATRSSSTRPDPGRPERPPSSDGRWKNWASR